MHAHWGAILNPIISLFDEEVRQFLRERSGSIPADSWLRTARFRRVFDVLRGAAEKGFHFDSNVLETFKEKLVDYGDYFTGAVGDGKTGEPSRAGVGKAAKEWMDRFSVEVQRRLDKTPPEKLEEESQRILLEFQLRRSFAEALEEAMREAKGVSAKAEPDEKRVWVDWDKMQDRFEGFLVGFAGAAGRIDGWAANTAAPQVRRFRQWLETKGGQR